MFVLVILSLFPNGALKSPSVGLMPAQSYQSEVACDVAAAGFNAINLNEVDADGKPMAVLLRAFCVNTGRT